VELLRSGCGIKQPFRSTKINLHPQKIKSFFVVYQNTQKMEIIFMLNFAICMLQIVKEEYAYEHSELIPPCFIFALFLGFWVGINWGWGLATVVSIFAFMVRFFLGSIRFAICIFTGTELRSGFYWKLFAWFALLETAIIWALLK